MSQNYGSGWNLSWMKWFGLCFRWAVSTYLLFTYTTTSKITTSFRLAPFKSPIYTFLAIQYFHNRTRHEISFTYLSDKLRINAESPRCVTFACVLFDLVLLGFIYSYTVRITTTTKTRSGHGSKWHTLETAP